MTVLEQADIHASKIAAVFRPLGRGPLSKKHAMVAANLLGVHWTTVYRLRRKFLANPVASAVTPRRRGPSKGNHRLGGAVGRPGCRDQVRIELLRRNGSSGSGYRWLAPDPSCTVQSALARQDRGRRDWPCGEFRESSIQTMLLSLRAGHFAAGVANTASTLCIVQSGGRISATTLSV